MHTLKRKDNKWQKNTLFFKKWIFNKNPYKSGKILLITKHSKNRGNVSKKLPPKRKHLLPLLSKGIPGSLKNISTHCKRSCTKHYFQKLSNMLLHWVPLSIFFKYQRFYKCSFLFAFFLVLLVLIENNLQTVWFYFPKRFSDVLGWKNLLLSYKISNLQ